MTTETVRRELTWDEDWDKFYSHATYCPNCQKHQTVYIRKRELVSSQTIICENANAG